MTKRRYVAGLLLIMMVFLVLGTVGCKNADETGTETGAETAGEATAEDGATGADDDTVTYETEDGATVEVTGEKADVPEGFPKDFPVYDAQIENSSKISGGEGTGFYVGLVTEDSYDDVFKWYKSELADEGWDILAEVTAGDSGAKSGVITISKGTTEGGVTFAQDGEVTRIAISINVK